MKELTPAERRALRARAHALHPTVMIGGAGLTGTVLREIDLALKHHELIKIRMLGEDRGARRAALERVCEAADAAPVQLIGRILVVFRPGPEPDPPVQAPPPAPRRILAKARRAPARVPRAGRGRRR
ncbi:MAG: YhbY family RNA-binding protein [Burkholderiales bacterium]|nr:YhbY family RNA-binding protein [Burkholderiales bacterium]